ncbi:geranylgeranylglycerol-phosphate geranylgeranyltransferase [Luteirhabdus pelagi]|uniref:geranylgeranylglycerol-phosphate geranylgeranyltransferase n=1 Tax=Luteirhabdus pelagi TaxID=2792783 RepID=UPI001EFF3568|nr:geranylgeranylglycerol-phosphate geranylgeranyltransferase [Luteirhabdus pelagi]
MMAYLRIIRPFNLLLIIIVQLLLKYSLFLPYGAKTALSNIDFAALVLATICIAAGGYIINDLYDVTVDRINKPKKMLLGKYINEKQANTYYIVLTSFGVLLGFYVSNGIGKPMFAAIFIMMAGLLYLYASYLKGMLLVGNLLVSVLVAMSLLIVPIFDLLPNNTETTIAIHGGLFSITAQYAFFAFLLTFIREIVKDTIDINGDKAAGHTSLAIAMGRDRAITIATGLLVVATLATAYYVYLRFYQSQPAVLYFVLLVIGPMIWGCIKGFQAESVKEYAFLSMLLKIIMLTGMCSLLLYPFVLLK